MVSGRFRSAFENIFFKVRYGSETENLSKIERRFGAFTNFRNKPT